MKVLTSFFLLLLAALASVQADAPPAPAPPVGIIIQKAVAGYDASAVWFVTIQWVDKDSGYVVEKDGTKLPFLNDAIGRVIYFDQGYYDEVDHNQYWVDWRIVMRDREMVLAPIEANSLQTDEAARLTSEQAALQDAIDLYPIGTAVVLPLIDTLKDQVAKLGSGLVLQNGNWIAAKDAVATENAVPVIGDSEAPVTFTTTDGKRFENARVTVTDTGLSVLTDDGGGSVSFEHLPKNISGFPKAVQDKITDWRTKSAAIAAAAAPVAGAPAVASTSTSAASSPAATAAPAPTGWWPWIVSTYHYVVDSTYAYFSPAKAATDSGTAVAGATPAPAPAPATAPVAAPAPAPVAAVTPAPAPAPAAAPATPNLIDTIVLIKGDNAEGTGFLTRTASGPVVITNLHVLAGNPNIRIMTSSGQEIVPLSLQGATDRDLAMFSIQDNHYTYLDLASDIGQNAAVGDATIIPGDSEGGEVTLKTNGKLVGIGPQQIEFDNPIFHGNSGGPVVDVKTGKVVAVATYATEMAPTDDLDKSSFANANSAIKGPMRYFGLRVDTVPSWQNYDEAGFVQETLFLKKFHEESRALDSYLNGARKEGPSPVENEGPLDANYYLTNDKIKKADEDCQTGQASGSVTAIQELVWNLNAVAGADLSSVQDPSTFYPYNQARAKYELKYRKALIDEIGHFQTLVRGSGVHST